MIEQLLALDGMNAVCRFRDDGALLEGYGLLNHDDMANVVRFAHEYCRMVQGNVDQYSLFTGIRGWTPPKGWIVRGDSMSLCGIGNVVCAVSNGGAPLDEVVGQLKELSNW